MQDELTDKVALFTGAINPITIAAARWIGNCGATLVFAGPSVSKAPLLFPLLYQFRRSLMCIDHAVDDSSSVGSLVSGVDKSLGRVDMLFHTLGPQAAPMEVDRFSVLPERIRNRNRGATAPLMSALIWTREGMRVMCRRGEGHVIHLVSRADVGSLEVERIVLERLKSLAGSLDPARGVSVSTIYVDGTGMLQGEARHNREARATEPRVLESFVNRLLDEDDWMSRVRLEHAIGSMVIGVCSPNRSAVNEYSETVGFHTDAMPFVERRQLWANS